MRSDAERVQRCRQAGITPLMSQICGGTAPTAQHLPLGRAREVTCLWFATDMTCILVTEGQGRCGPELKTTRRCAAAAGRPQEGWHGEGRGCRPAAPQGHGGEGRIPPTATSTSGTEERLCAGRWSGGRSDASGQRWWRRWSRGWLHAGSLRRLCILSPVCSSYTQRSHKYCRPVKPFEIMSFDM